MSKIAAKAAAVATENEKPTRSPIVVVMGHVDHGKTSLLDYIKKTNVTAKEAGGITQSIGAYEVVHPPVGGRRLTFIDTPGHEAFSKMRSRGAKVADLAVLVVAADDGVKPQTKEAIRALKEAETTFVVAINKIDKNNADIERAKNELLQNEVLLEGYGGDVSFGLISAKTGEGVNELLDLLLLAADFEDLSYSPAAPARGIVIESKLDRRRGNEVMIVLKEGTLRSGEEIATETASGKVKILETFLGERVSELKPSSPAVIIGFESLPSVGEEFIAGAEAIKKDIHKAEAKPTSSAKRGDANKDELALRLIIKADVQGSLEVITDIVSALPQPEVKIRIMESRVGDITDGDVKQAIANSASIFGFRVGPTKAAEYLATANGVKIHSAEIIYDLVRIIEEEVNNLKSPKPLGVLEVLALFNQKSEKQLIGGKVVEGMIKIKAVMEVQRGETVMGRGRVLSLRQAKKEVTIVEAGKECGFIFDSPVKIEVGDRLLYKVQVNQ